MLRVTTRRMVRKSVILPGILLVGQQGNLLTVQEIDVETITPIFSQARLLVVLELFYRSLVALEAIMVLALTVRLAGRLIKVKRARNGLMPLSVSG
jgi:hypothetical protein